MDINSQQQINTFVGGMNTDTSDALLDSNQYRYAENLRIVTNTDSNSGELRIIDGILTLIDKYINKDTDSKRWDEILYMTSVRQYLILITKVVNKQNNTAGWSIYRWEEGKEKPDCIFGPCGEAIWDESGNTNLSVVTRYESELNIKMYIVDGIHQIMSLNVYNTPETEITDIKNLISDLENPIVPLEVSVSSTSTGELKAARVLYAYRLYQKYGSVTTLSPLSKLLSLYKDNNTGYEKGAKTGRAVDITIPNVTYEYMSKILIFRINYIENGQEPTVMMIYDGDYVKEDSFVDDGTKDITTISVSELLSYIQTGIIPKEIETKNNYLFAANVKYSVTNIDNKFKELEGKLDEYVDIKFWQDASFKHYVISDKQLNDDYTSLYPSFRPGETYRFGIIFYDKNGNKSSVFHLKDLEVPENKYKGMFMTTNDNMTYNAAPIGLKVERKKAFPPEYECTHFEIVRCIRTLNDKRTISQGIIGRPAELFNNRPSPKTKNVLAHSGFMTMNDFRTFSTINSNGGTIDYFTKLADNFIQFASPEYVYQPDDVKNIINQYKNVITLKTVSEFVANTESNTETVEVLGTTDTSALKYVKSVSNQQKHPYKFSYRTVIDSGAFGIQSLHELYIDSNTQLHNLGTTFNVLYPKNTRLSYLTNKDLHYDEVGNSSDDLTDSEHLWSYNITDFVFPNVPNWNDMANQENLMYEDAVDSIGGYSYYEWSNPFLTLLPNGTDSELREAWKNGNTNNSNVHTKSFFPTGSGGKHILFKTSSEIPECYRWERSTTSHTINGNERIGISDGPFLITIADLRKPANPYGGTSKYAIENSVYSSFGQIFENVKTLNDKIVYFGDSYIRMFKYNALHAWYDATYNSNNISKMATVYCVPIMMDIDLHAQFGTLYDRDMNKPYYIQDEPCSFDGYNLETSAYLYNTAYNQQNDTIQYGAYKEEDNKDLYDVRVHYSELKTNNEHIDNWTLFKSMNFLEVDSSFGLITDLKLFKDRLIFWQEHATGILAVNERVILQDANNTQVVLGTGSVLDRYDYISTTHGMKPEQHSSCVSDDYLYWWDGYNKEILQYAEKYSATPLSLVKNIRNYINENKESDKPHIYYNRKYKEVGCQCLKNGNNSNGEVIAYNELLQRFTSVYTARNVDRSINYGFAPIYDTYLNGNLLITDGNSVYKQSLNKETSLLFDNLYVQPYLKYIVNTNNTLGKTYDMQIIGGNLYNSKDEALTVDSKLDVIDFEKVQRFLNQPSLKDEPYNHRYHTTEHLKSLQLRYTTPLKQEGVIKDGKGITNREYDYRLNIPRETGNDVYGGRLRGKTMQCELWSTSSSTDFSLQYITTKYRMSWS